MPMYHHSAMPFESQGASCQERNKHNSGRTSIVCFGPEAPPPRADIPKQGLPSFKELSAAIEKEKIETPTTPTSRASRNIPRWQISLKRLPRQSSTESPACSDPFTDHSSKRTSIQHMPEPMLAGNYAIRGSQASLGSLMHAPSSSEHRRTSIRPEYEPNIFFKPSSPAKSEVGYRLPSIVDSSSSGLQVDYNAPLVHNIHHHSSIRRVSNNPFQSLDPQEPYRHRRQCIVMEYPHGPRYRRDRMFQPPNQQVPHRPYGHAGNHCGGIDPYFTRDVQLGRKRRGNLPKEATSLLKRWFADHHESPYPTYEEKNQLAIQTNLDFDQVSNWFTNARRRQLGRESQRTGSPPA